MANDFAVPVAWDVSCNTIWPEEAQKQTNYTCPECLDTIRLRGGPKVRLHFYHIKPGDCTGEGALHAAAKFSLARRIARGRSVSFPYVCSYCGHDARYGLPRRVASAKTEARLGDYRVDIGLLSEEEGIIAAIEILDSHRVDERKGADLGVPWAEVKAADVLANPSVLRPVMLGGGWRVPQRCGYCRNGLVQFKGDFERYMSDSANWTASHVRNYQRWRLRRTGFSPGLHLGGGMWGDGRVTNCPKYPQGAYAATCMICPHHEAFHLFDPGGDASHVHCSYPAKI